MPPACNTGAEVTGVVEAGVHWMTGMTVQDAGLVLDWLAGTLGESVEVRDRGLHGYTEAWQVGPAVVLANPDRADMGVCVELNGSACDELGLAKIAAIHAGLELRVSRLDLAFDGVGFTPADLREAWEADSVRTRAKIPEKAREDRQFRTCKWYSSPTGDTFSMGSRSSSQYARCYDERGPVRFELELKKKAAAEAAGQLFGVVSDGNSDVFAAVALSWVRRFVDFVDTDSDENVSRRTLLPFWETFVKGAEKAVVTLEGRVLRTVEDMAEWIEKQGAPTLAVLVHALGWHGLRDIIRKGVPRLKGRHREALRLHRSVVGAGV